MSIFTSENMLLNELEVVNSLLQAVGYSSVATLDDPEILGVAEEAAILSFKRASRFVQTSGWWFNDYPNQELTPDTNGNIHLPANTMKVDAANKQLDIIQAGLRLKDKAKNSFIFTGAVNVDMTLMQPFEELPSTARLHIQAIAIFMHKVEEEADAFAEFTTKENSMQTYLLLYREHVNATDANLFGNTRSVDLSTL